MPRELPGPSPPRRAGHRRALTRAVSARLGAPVAVAVPLQRHRPTLVLGLAVVELAALAVLMATGSPAALAGLATVAVGLAGVALTNRRRILAVTAGEILVLDATLGGRPRRVLGPAAPGLRLPAPAGLEAGVELDGRRWWIDRTAYARLDRAHQSVTGPA